MHKHRLEIIVNTIRCNIAVSPDVDQSVRAYLLERAVNQAKTATADMAEAELNDLINEAVQWAREH